MSDLLKCLLVMCLVGALPGCSGESPSSKPSSGGAAQELDSANQGSDTKEEKQPSSGSDRR